MIIIMREYIKLGGILFIITFTVALSLGVVNSLTKDKIAQNTQNAQSEAGKGVIGDTAQDGTEVSYPPTGNTSVDKITEHTLANGEKAYSVSCKPVGYGGTISITVGLDSNLNVTGVAITNMKETPGLGARAKEPSFYEQFIGKKEGVSVTKDTPNGNQIQAISGATITSKAVTKGVNDAISEVKSISKTQTPNTVATSTPAPTPTPTEAPTQKPTATVTPKPTATVAPTPNVPAKAITSSYTPSGNTSVYKISRTVLANGQKTYSIYCKTVGYESEISMIVGLDNNLNVTNVNITSINDTPGRGSRATEPSFLGQFIGKKLGVSVTRGTPTGNQIQAISGATITSKAVAKGVNDAISEAQAIAGGGN